MVTKRLSLDGIQAKIIPFRIRYTPHNANITKLISSARILFFKRRLARGPVSVVIHTKVFCEKCLGTGIFIVVFPTNRRMCRCS